MNVVIRPAETKDIIAIDKLGSCSYPNIYHESLTSFTTKITAGESLVADVGGYIAGYLIAVPYTLETACPLNTNYTPVENPDCLYIHDLCVSELFRGLGLGTQLAKDILSRDWPAYALVSVLGSTKFWASLGFTHVRELNYHGLPGVYMELKR